MIRSIDCFWLEGVYWRLCVRFGKAVDEEEEGARRGDWRRFSDFVAFPGEGFVLRVDFFENARGRAVCAARELYDAIGMVLDGRVRKELKGCELGRLISEASLSGWHQRTVWKEDELVLTNLHSIAR